MLKRIKKRITGKYVRYFMVSFELLPAGWSLKPSWYRFDHNKADSKLREGQFNWLFFGLYWNRDLA